MCGRFTLTDPARVKLDRLTNFDLSDLVPRYNIAPSQEVLAVVERDSVREATFFQWGLIPAWSKEAKGIINARTETIDQKASFSDSFKRRRCLIPADGFYEWERNGKISQPYYFRMESGEPFAFAGIWDRWQGPNRSIASCAIITTTANELLSKIHHRMPVIIGPESYDLWLNDDVRTEHLKDLLVPFPASAMISHAVSYDVNDPKIDNDSLLREVEPNIGVTLRLF
jgi:putative SOS response-associated peptidase YedK